MERSEGLSRRQMIGAAAGTAATAAVGSALVPGAAGAKKGLRSRENLVPRQNIGIQMYSLRDMAGADLPGTLDMLEDIGYPEVELAGLYGRTAAELRTLLDERQHPRDGRARGHRSLARRTRRSARRGRDARHAVCRRTRASSRRPPPMSRPIETSLRELNRYGKAAADRGLRLYYHNHDFEFAKDGGQVLYDVMLERTDPDLVFFELDLYWIVTAGRDPLDYLGSYDQSRWPLFHAKDRTAGSLRSAGGTFADLGEGIINFQRIFSALENKHYHHFFVERDTQVNPPRTARVGYEYLRDLRGVRRHKPYKPSQVREDTATSARAARKGS